MHSAMEFIYKTFQQTGNYPALADLQQQFSLSLKQEVMTPVEHEKRLKHGKEVLVHYHEQLTGKNPDPLYIEKMFGNSKHKVMLDDIPLNGRIDRVDWVDKENKQVKVIDYKTGKTRSANDIEGKTKSAKLSERERELPESIRGPYKRQLLFYKLLAKLDRGFPYEVMSGEFEFVEPNNAGKIVTRNFELLDEDVRVLGELIKEVVEELRGRW